jgi:hypothetical protein
VAAPAVTRAGGKVAGIAAGCVMVALLAAIALSGEWPTNSALEAPKKQGIVSLPANQVSRIEVSAGETDLLFQRERTGWLVNGVSAEHAVSDHIDSALHMMTVTNPTRVLEPGDYTANQLADFGLDPPRLLVSLATSEGQTRGITFGEATPAQNAQYARVIGQPNLYLLSRYIGVEWQLALDMANRALPRVDPAAQSRAFLLPVSFGVIWAVEVVENGTLTRFERDPAGDWFHHVGQHVHKPGGFVHKADPKFAPLIAAELAGLERASVESVVARHPGDDTLGEYGLEHPSAIMLLYTRDTSTPVARVEFGKATPDGFARYARVRETDSVVTVPVYAAAHVDKLLKLAGVQS